MESTERISPPTRSATNNAAADLPTPVGPAINRLAPGTLARLAYGCGGTFKLLALQGMEEQQSDANTNRAIGQIERGKSNFASPPLMDVEIKKINHMPPRFKEAICQI